MVFNEPNNIECVLQYRTEKGFVEDKPQRRFILDLDCFSKDIESKKVLDTLKTLNKKIFDIYYWSITEKQKEILRKG